MEKRIEIQRIEQKRIDEKLEVIYEIDINGNNYNLTYKISGEDIESIPLFCDAVVVNLIAYAVKFGLNFYSEYPISEKLYYNLTKHVIPQLSVANKTKTNMIQIDIPRTKEVYQGKWVGTGISLGVDSFTTMHEYMENCDIDEYRLTHLVHLKTGAHHGNMPCYDKEKEEELFLVENENVKKFCRENGYNLITVESNLLEVTSKAFGYGFAATHTFRNMGCILLLQNYFSKYYYASAYNLDHFKVDLNKDTSHYEKWLLPYISNDSLSLYSANTNMSRIQKTKYISQFADTYDNLHVCWENSVNCGRCKKCVRTMVTLDVLGVLDKYSKSFDTEYYYKNRKTYITEVIMLRKTDLSNMEIYKYMLKSGFKMPPLFSRIVPMLKILYLRIKKQGFNKCIEQTVAFLKKK